MLHLLLNITVISRIYHIEGKEIIDMRSGGYPLVVDCPEKRVLITKMAKDYILSKASYDDLSKKYHVGRGTVWKYFNVTLPQLSPTLHYLVRQRARYKAKIGRNKGLNKLKDYTEFRKTLKKEDA